jgi:hypothetical protein
MRFSQTLTLAFGMTLACGAAAAADFSARIVTYLKGNIEGIEQNAGGTLNLVNVKVLTLRAHESKVEVPYSAIVGAERKDVVITEEKEPIYKVWKLAKHLDTHVRLQDVSFDYKDKTGNLHSMTLQMETSSADRLFARLKQVADKKADTRGDFWGDSIWKTHRNEAGWNAQHDPEDNSVATR